VGNSFWLAGHIGKNWSMRAILSTICMDLFDLTFERKLAFHSPFSKNEAYKEAFVMFYEPKNVRGPDVAKA